MLHHMLRAAAGRDRIPTDGLVAHYTMDNISGSTLIDEQGNFDGTIVGATQVTGNNGQALRFTSTSDRVEVDGVLGGQTIWTVCVICNPVDNVNGGVYHYGWSGIDQDAGTAIVLNEPGSSWVRFLYRHSSGTSTQVESTSPLPSYPSCLMFGVDGSNIFIEVDGVNFNESIPSTPTTLLGKPSSVGNRDSDSLDFGGWIDDTGIYNRALTEDEKQAWRNLV